MQHVQDRVCGTMGPGHKAQDDSVGAIIETVMKCQGFRANRDNRLFVSRLMWPAST